MNTKTFFLSEDINLILNGNSQFGDFYKNKGITVPTKSKISSLRDQMLQNLKNTYTNVETIPEDQLFLAMQTMAKNSNYPLVSLDEIYLKNNENVAEYLSLSRIKIAGKTFMTTRSSQGLYIPFEKEISRVCNNLENKFGGNCPHRNFAY